MSSLETDVVVFFCVFGGALGGMLLHTRLSARQFSSETQDVIKLGIGLITMMNALVLGLLISSAKASYDTKRAEMTQMAADAILADRSLSLFGPETSKSRVALHSLVLSLIRQIETSHHTGDDNPTLLTSVELTDFYRKVRELSARTDEQKSLKREVLRISLEIGQLRALVFAQRTSSIPTPLLVVLVFWLTILFVSFGLFAPATTTSGSALFVCALSVAAAILMMLDMDRPFAGFIQISSLPLRNALGLIGI